MPLTSSQRGFLLNPTYRIVDSVPEIHLHGVLECGEPCLIVEDRWRPYFFVPAARMAEIRSRLGDATVEPTDLRAMDGSPVARVTARLPVDVPALRSRIEGRGIPCFEADVRFAYRFLIDQAIRGAFEVEGTYRAHARHGRVYRNPILRPAHWVPRLKVLSLDIETDPKAEHLYSIALATPGFERAIVVHHGSLADADSVPSEKAAIRRFLEYLREIDPDVLSGWNVVDFDLACLSRIARAHGIRLTLGRDEEAFAARKDASFTRESRAVVYGRQVLDGLSLVRGAFLRLDDYKLETASRTFLGKGKLLRGDHRAHQIDELYRNDPQALVAYNLQDARLVLEILDKLGLVELAIERSLLTGMQLDRVSAAIASVDSLYLGALRHRGFVAPSVGAVVPSGALGGGYVMDSKPGLYRNVLVFDFKSLYPSIIRTFNLDPLTLLPEPDTAAIQAPNGACFRRDRPGVLPGLLSQLADERQQAKYRGNGVKANAIKILMNSFYGVLGAPASRLFSPSVANAITGFGQYVIQHAASFARGRGYEVLYGDTDSLFVLSRSADAAAALELGERLSREIGADVARMIRREHELDSVLELEFEKLYLRFFLPEVRGGATGSKKRYAGLRTKAGKEEVELVGLEAVRRDWSEVSKRFQRGLLERVFHDEPLEEYIQSVLADLRGGRLDAQLVYKKALRKDLGAYTKTTPAHVKAARKQTRPGGRIVEYIVTRNGPEPLDNLTAPPDYEHYVEHQLAPIADAILRFLGTSFGDIVSPARQLSLF